MFTEWLVKLQNVFVWDMLWVTGIVLGMVLFAYTLGKHAMVPLLAAISTAAVISSFAAFVGRIPFLANFAEHEQRVLMFFALLIVSFIVFRKNRFFEPCVVPSGWELVIFAVIYAGFTLAILGSFLPPEVIGTLSTNVRIVFVDDFPSIIWLISPLVLLSVFRGGVD
ncbi:MAG: hypothetical protein NUV56_01785 [Candidatus Uhrbacteria bacterium]|nr:hypothetical protein [Candidatus Uhrbacteria bacterium]